MPTEGDEAPPRGYSRRIIDDELDELLPALPAIAIDGPRAVGKTATALQRAATVYRLDEDAELTIARADPGRLTQGAPPILIDEWQRLPESFDRVRRSVDDGAPPGSYLLTGSASPTTPPTHPGAGRIVRLRLRPMSLAERRIISPTVSVGELLDGGRPALEGRSEFGLEQYVEEILASGFPAIRRLPDRARVLQLDGYLARIVDRDFEALGREVRRPATLRRWLQAYAAAASTTASFATIRDAAARDHGGSPTKASTLPYRDILERLWLLDPVPAWLPTRSRLARLGSPPKHHLADPALAARLLDVNAATLLTGRAVGPVVPREGTLLGALFESLATLSVRVYAEAAGATVGHLRTWRGEHEVDLVLERGDGVVAVEVKLGQVVDDRDVRHLVWLREQLRDDFIDGVVVTTGVAAYRRPDGVGVVPACLLGV